MGTLSSWALLGNTLECSLLGGQLGQRLKTRQMHVFSDPGISHKAILGRRDSVSKGVEIGKLKCGRLTEKASLALGLGREGAASPARWQDILVPARTGLSRQ